MGKRGPAPFQPTAKQRRDVALYAAGGMSEPGIASELGICQNTLRKHFAADILAGHEREIAANLRRLRKAADDGNVTAMKHLDTKFELVGAKVSFGAEQPRAAKPGKKEVVRQDAMIAGHGNEWGDDLKAPIDGLPN